MFSSDADIIPDSPYTPIDLFVPVTGTPVLTCSLHTGNTSLGLVYRPDIFIAIRYAPTEKESRTTYASRRCNLDNEKMFVWRFYVLKLILRSILQCTYFKMICFAINYHLMKRKIFIYFYFKIWMFSYAFI